jgi:hypothetical protein
VRDRPPCSLLMDVYGGKKAKADALCAPVDATKASAREAEKVADFLVGRLNKANLNVKLKALQIISVRPRTAWHCCLQAPYHSAINRLGVHGRIATELTKLLPVVLHPRGRAGVRPRHPRRRAGDRRVSAYVRRLYQRIGDEATDSLRLGCLQSTLARRTPSTATRSIGG